MSTWLEKLNSKRTEATKKRNTPIGLSRPSGHDNRRQRKSTRRTGAKATGVSAAAIAATRPPPPQATAPVTTTLTSGGRRSGILGALTANLRRFESVSYAALNQRDIEAGWRTSGDDDNNNNNNSISSSSSSSSTEIGGEQSVGSGGSSSSSSDSEEDLFVARGRRKVRRKMTRKGTYSMHEAFHNDRQGVHEINCEQIYMAFANIWVAHESKPNKFWTILL